MNVDDEENNSVMDETNTSDKLLNEQDTNCSETLHYCAHCDYAAKTIFDIKDHIERKHAPEEVIICSNNEKSDMEFISEDGKFDIYNDYSDIWACYNCNRWETDERCQICNKKALELYERERESF